MGAIDKAHVYTCGYDGQGTCAHVYTCAYTYVFTYEYTNLEMMGEAYVYTYGYDL